MVLECGVNGLQSLYQRYATYGFLFAVCLHLCTVGALYITGHLSGNEEKVIYVRLRPTEMPPPPSIGGDPAVAVNVASPATKPSVGIPVPVPDAEVSPDQTFARQQDMNPTADSLGIATDPNARIEIQPRIEAEDPNPGEFVAVEKLPEVVRDVRPVFPEIARRAGVEGRVWVQVLVNKEGRVKKALIVKTDAEIFNDPAIEAAKQWVFSPAIMSQGPVSVWVVRVVVFKLNKQN
jgi:protein TonB